MFVCVCAKQYYIKLKLPRFVTFLMCFVIKKKKTKAVSKLFRVHTQPCTQVVVLYTCSCVCRIEDDITAVLRTAAIVENELQIPKASRVDTMQWKKATRLTNVIFMVDDGVERHIFVPQVALGRLHIISPMVCINKALKLTIDDRAVS